MLPTTRINGSNSWLSTLLCPHSRRFNMPKADMVHVCCSDCGDAVETVRRCPAAKTNGQRCNAGARHEFPTCWVHRNS